MKILLFIFGFEWCGFGAQGERDWDYYRHRLFRKIELVLENGKLRTRDYDWWWKEGQE